MGARAPTRRYLRPGELYAIRPEYVQHDADHKAFFWLFGPPVFQNEREDGISVVRINGPLEYHKSCWSDSYESIVYRIECAMTGQDEVDREKARRRMAKWDTGIEITDPLPDPTRPHCVVLRIDSPGGVVAGLGQTVDCIRRLSKTYDIPIYAYADETAYSAAYALCCGATGGIYLPKSGLIGSVGVIATLVDESKMDEKFGLRFVIITSGKHKADGHPHAPITDEMVAEESPRVITLANQFFQLVNRARGVSLATIQGWEAKRFLGEEATTNNLADEILSWHSFMSKLKSQYSARVSLPQAKFA